MKKRSIGTIVVTGASGFFGHHIMEVLEKTYAGPVVGLSSRDYDLTEERQVARMYEKIRPDIMINCAAYVGGIGANKQFPADFYYKNILINTFMIHYASVHGVKKYLSAIGGCGYPAHAPSPIAEDQFWKGFPQPESASYSLAKNMTLIQSEAYRRQHGLNAVVIVPGNMYGEHDNFQLASAHVVPAMLRKFYEAKLKNAPEVVLWGTGKPKRDFVYVKDVARLIPYFLEKYQGSEPVNISTGRGTSIAALAKAVKKVTGYEGKLVQDTSKPDGQMIKIFDVKRLKKLGFSCNTDLTKGLMLTARWFEQNYHKKGKVRL